jgi:hypothetical protein
MTPSQEFDPAEFKRNIRTEWRSAAAAWRKWLEVVEAKTDSPEQYTEFIRDVAPQLTTLLGDQPTVVQRVWEKVTDAYRQFQGDDGRVLTENQAIWFKGIK